MASLTIAFDPAAFPDAVKARVEEAIQRKVEGKQVTVAETQPAPAGNVVDLMSALKASPERGSKPSGQARRPPRRAPAKAPARAHSRAGRKAAHS